MIIQRPEVTRTTRGLVGDTAASRSVETMTGTLKCFLFADKSP